MVTWVAERLAGTVLAERLAGGTTLAVETLCDGVGVMVALGTLTTAVETLETGLELTAIIDTLAGVCSFAILAPSLRDELATGLALLVLCDSCLVTV